MCLLLRGLCPPNGPGAPGARPVSSGSGESAPVTVIDRSIRRSLPGHGRGASMVAFTTLKIVVVTPMPNASVRMVAADVSGVRTRARSARR